VAVSALLQRCQLGLGGAKGDFITLSADTAAHSFPDQCALFEEAFEGAGANLFAGLLLQL